jgi:hypothetical protein
MLKRLLLLTVILLAPAAAWAQNPLPVTPDCSFGFTYSVVGGVISSTTPLSAQRLPLSAGGGNVVGYDNRAVGCTTWTITYQGEGVGSLSIELDNAPSSSGVPGSWSTWTTSQNVGNVAYPLTTVAQSDLTSFRYYPWVSVNLNSAGGTGTVYGKVIGYKPGSTATSIGSAGTGPSLVTTSTSPALITGVTILATGPGAANGNALIGQINSSGTGVTPAVATVGPDRCNQSGTAKSFFQANITTATTTSLVPVNGAQVIYLCKVTVSMIGTVAADTIQLEYGTGAACVTTQTPITAVHSSGILTAGATVINFDLSGTASAASGVLCAVSTVGTGPNIAVMGTYVQQ